MTTRVATTRPGGRSARIRRDVLAATIVLLEEDRQTMTIPAVATRAGVAPSTIYRRWGDVDTLCADAALTMLDSDTSTPNTGNTVEDLITWAESIAANSTRPEYVRCLRSIVATLDADKSRVFLEDRERQLDEILTRAWERGETTPGREEISDRVLAPLYFRILFERPHNRAHFVQDLVVELYADGVALRDTALSR